VDAQGDDNKGAEVKLARDGKEVHCGTTSLEKVEKLNLSRNVLKKENEYSA